MDNCKSEIKIPANPYSFLPSILDLKPVRNIAPVPDEKTCYVLWQKYEMLENIKKHSAMVAHIAVKLGEMAVARGQKIDISACLAAGLLHDLAKTWCLAHGGSHAQLGAVWVAAETGNFAIAQAVLLHVYWPWAIPQNSQICNLPIFLMYADKRVRHDQCVTLAERFEDVLVRYGKTPEARAAICETKAQALEIEKLLSQQLGRNLNEDSFDCRRLVN